MTDLTLTGLRVVLEVARTGSFSAAAERLGYTQSAVSRQVAEGDHGLEIYLRGAVFSPDGSHAIRLSRTGTPAEAVEIGRLLAADLLAEGADTVLGSTA